MLAYYSIYLYHIWHCCHQESFEVLQWRNLVSKKGTHKNDEHVDHLHEKTEIYHNTKQNKWKNLMEMTSTEITLDLLSFIYPSFQFIQLNIISYLSCLIHTQTSTTEFMRTFQTAKIHTSTASQLIVIFTFRTFCINDIKSLSIKTRLLLWK